MAKYHEFIESRLERDGYYCNSDIKGGKSYSGELWYAAIQLNLNNTTQPKHWNKGQQDLVTSDISDVCLCR